MTKEETNDLLEEIKNEFKDLNDKVDILIDTFQVDRTCGQKDN